MSKTNRKQLSVTESLHADLASVSAKQKLPMTVIIRHWLENYADIDWSPVREGYELSKMSWSGMRSRIEALKEKHPDISKEQISKLTGLSMAQIEVFTGDAHLRCIKHLKSGKPFSTMAEKCAVSDKFANRIKDQFDGNKDIPQHEQDYWVGV